jgi:hypothetical protein
VKSISEASIKRHETDPLLRKKHVSAKINKISPKQSVQNNQAGQGGVGRGGAGRGGAGHYSRCRRTPPSGKYSPCIALADAMVIVFGVKIELWCCEINFQSLH